MYVDTDAFFFNIICTKNFFFFVHANIPICMLSVTSNETAHWELGHKLPLTLMNMCCPLLFGTWLSNVLLSSSAGEKASHYQQPLEIRNILEKLIWTQRFPALASFSHDSILKNKLERSFPPLSAARVGLLRIHSNLSERFLHCSSTLSCTVLHPVRSQTR